MSLLWGIMSGEGERGDKGFPSRYEDHFCQSFCSGKSPSPKSDPGKSLSPKCACAAASWDGQFLGVSPAQQRGNRQLPASRAQSSQCCRGDDLQQKLFFPCRLVESGVLETAGPDPRCRCAQLHPFPARRSRRMSAASLKRWREGITGAQLRVCGVQKASWGVKSPCLRPSLR